jgi:hypothetical protein
MRYVWGRAMSEIGLLQSGLKQRASENGDLKGDIPSLSAEAACSPL